MRRLPLFVVLLATSAIAHAGDKPLYQPMPDWVKPAPAIDATKLGDDAPMVLIFDNQQRLENGRAWSYMETATRAASAEALSSIGTIKIDWQPSQGDLIVHRAQIIRGAERIDLIKNGNPLTVLRREEGMEQRVLDGRLTATMPVEGLRVGDVLDVAFSVTRRDPTLKGDVQAFAPLLLAPLRVQFARARLSWPVGSDIKWKAYADGVAAQPVVEGGYKTLTVTMPLAKQPEMPDDAPARFAKLPLLEVTSFADWAAVSKVMAPLYATDGLIAPGSSLAAEVARIKAAESDPLKRAALALQLVQDKIRYLMLGMDTGNYVPQSPTRTWELRYGDCKAKTLLLLALLHEMGIEAEPVTANSQLGDLVPSRLPSAAAFDHVLVRATINGETLWLDGTGAGARLADIRDTPPLGYVLPLRAVGAEPVRIALHAPARPDMTLTFSYDQGAGINLPAPFSATVTMKGAVAQLVRLAKTQGSQDDFEKLVNRMIANFDKNATLVSRDFSFDEAAGTATVTATGVAYPAWDRENERWRRPLYAAQTEFSPDRARTAWKDIPVKTDAPFYVMMRTRLRLPRAGFTIDGAKTEQAVLAGHAVDRSVTQEGEWIVATDKTTTSGVEIPVADIPAERRKVAAAKANSPRAIAPADYPSSWDEIAPARRDKKLDPILAVYTRQIRDRPDDRTSYTNRAWFLERVYDRKAAIADLDKALAIEPDADTYVKRARLYAALGNDDKALADAIEANRLDPSDDDALARLANSRADRGEKTAALDLIQERIDQGDKNKADYMSFKATLQMKFGDKDGAIETIDGAIGLKPADAGLLNTRCWLKGLGNVALDTALKDCTKAIALSDNSAQVLDSRAMIYFRMGRMDEALADLDSALAIAPDMAASLYMRGVIRRHSGKTKEGDSDLAAARTLSPRIDRDYSRYGIVP
ncbi:DUF3857 domain-containing protein [Sphingomonas sp. MMSM20]|uniref:DUF3857 domain-containing protein n=1 Tax=Sphingomonas lycopersici TaxID=2951807 RepID=UPI0022390296|nr:DUF3857 domain-containing protein [Sphingomonas lycopersici]MCW6531837.1 DUF3857 domain-containing protein [Sphingomonas lycopersici]